MSTEERSVNQPEEQPSLSEQRLIRRAKLKELQDAGQDPFQITKFVVSTTPPTLRRALRTWRAL